MEKEFLSVFSADIARAMLKRGYQIVDLKPDKLDRERKRSIFIFKNEDGLYESICEFRREKEKNNGDK